jgi:hypothetical protein
LTGKSRSAGDMSGNMVHRLRCAQRMLNLLGGT